MAAQSRIWMFAHRFYRVSFMNLLLLGLLLHQEDVSTVQAQVPDAGKRYLDQKESEVKWIASNASLNNENCGSLDGCSAACSRVTCSPLSGGRESLLCTTVDNNEFFSICPSGACKNKMMLDYNRSFVTLPTPGSLNLSTEIARDICLQRRLDSTFKDVSFPSNYSNLYFGSSSGAFRSFPGRERTEDQCTSYDPRRRPWYLNSISVKKDVKILLDIGNRMGNVVSSDYKLHPPGTTYLDVAKNITLGLLQTFSSHDYIEVFSFDSSYVTSLRGAFTASDDVFNGLLTDVYNLKASPDMASSNSSLNYAILMAVESFNTADSLKVIVVLTNELFIPLNSIIFPSLELQLLQAKLMVYKLPTDDDSGNPFLLKTLSLQENICSVNGSFEGLNALETANPLYSMRSYFTFLARAQLASVANNATWSNPYLSFSRDRNTITATYPAFGSDGFLIGVAGVDVFIDDLNDPLKDLVFAEYINRTKGTQAALLWRATIPMVCNYQSTTTNSVCQNSTLPDSSAICPRNDTSSTLADLTCCGTCGSGEVITTPWFVVLTLIAAVAVLAIAAFAGIYYKFKTGTIKSFSPVEVALLNLNLCESVVHKIEGLVNSGGSSKRKSTQNLLIEIQSMDFPSKLSEATQNIRQIVLHFRASVVLFKSVLEELCRDLEKVKLYLCEIIVHNMERLMNSGGSSKRKSTQNFLNRRQCQDLSTKLSKTTQNIREIVFHCRAAPILFRPALEKLYLDLEKAKLLVMKCGEEDWCTASVFQSQNDIAFQEILLDVGLCYNAIYEQARSTNEERNLPEDLRQSYVFKPASQSDIYEDQVELQKRLQALANGHRLSMKQCLARYLLAKLNHTSDQSEANASETCSPILWAQKTEPPGTWGSHIRFLGAGSGASGVCSTKWMGIPCAKKEFHLKEFERFFLKEAGILAHLKHPCVVNFFCCGNGEQKGDRFIAMELMEKSLSDLIEDQGAAYFSLPVVVDIMVQIARGVCYLHGQGIAHRDLKPQNVVVKALTSSSSDRVDYYFVKLVDFGMSKTKVQVSKSNTISIPGVGTTNYRAPEVHPKAHPDGIGKASWFKADVFSFAMTCAHILSLEKPFGNTKMSKVYKNLMNGRRPELPKDCSQELGELLKDCWDASPCSRPSFVEIWTRLEVFRHKILRGFPTSEPNSQQQENNDTSYEFIKLKVQEHSRTSIQRPFDAISIEVEDIIQSGLPIRGKMGPDKGTKFHEIYTSATTVEMTQRSSRQRSFSF